MSSPTSRSLKHQRQPLLWKQRKNNDDDDETHQYRQIFRLVHFRSATNSSMSKPAVNRAAAPMQTSAISGEARSDLMISSTVGRYVCGSRTLNVFIGSRHQTSPLVKAFIKPFSEFAFTDTPLATDFESRQLLALGHTRRSAQ